MPPSTKQMERTRVRPVNPERKERRFVETYHSDEFVAWIHSLACCVPGCPGRSEAVHVRSRGAGGTWEDIVPMCNAHHRALHDMGVRTFSAHLGLDLPIIARVHAAVWKDRMADLRTIDMEARQDLGPPPEGGDTAPPST